MQDEKYDDPNKESLKNMNIIEGRKNIRDEIIRLHEEYEIPLDKEFERNNLLPMDGKTDFSLSYENYYLIFEKFPGKHFKINLPVNLILHFKDLLKHELISKISFKIECISDYAISMEQKEIGSELNFKLDDIPDISRFYSDNYEEQFWISHNVNKKSIIFEEINNNELDDNLHVITNVVHLMYIEDNGIFYINHIDHEKISYTIEEFEKKFQQKNSKIKGLKEKTFKIDNSMIPIDYKFENEFFIYRVLDSYISNKDLLKEYLEKVMREA
ncbi:hypothetical protein NMW10_06900 [Pasteurella multocida]|uniref:hypothetical protein n=1 Tax=Pasteurella multocida TaxID=747 RepID=UPI0020201A93|nr:hypothetical protein [Pasteurella multocida]MCL7816115.1 hypothetical protein [Pasteurella multocida]MDY0641192.1 hypothetical protein [Pasteurella multocida]HDR1026355.1 hypothetical protein [Pasteurella multocida]HDR1027258.1 hypothetical protein [Pasteurella multocida]